MEELKIWLVVRRDLNIPAPKLAVQSGHAFMGLATDILYGQSSEEILIFEKYLEDATPKIVTGCKNLLSLRRIASVCEENFIPFHTVTDAGRTVFEEPTTTCLAFGPRRFSELPDRLKRLNLLS